MPSSTSLSAIADSHATFRNRRVKSTYSTLMTERLKKEMYHRDYLKKRSIRSGFSFYHKASKKAKTRVNKIIEQTKREFYLQNITQHESNPKELWKNVNQLRGKSTKTTVISSLKDGDKLVSIDLGKAQ